MLVYAVDVGTTNLKAVLFDDQLRRLAIASTPAVYDRDGDRVEFDPDQLFTSLIDLIHQCHRDAGDVGMQDAVIVLTGQAESIVLNDSMGNPVRPGMSWLDDRAVYEATEIGERFGVDSAFEVTGEPAPSATWPAAKLRWLARHEPDTLAATTEVLMVKDDLVRRFTGCSVGDATTRGFTYLYDVQGRHYWRDMLDFVSVSEDTLPEDVRAGTDVGPVTPAVAERLPAAVSYRVNTGALDHFCAMIGTGSYRPDVVSESAGTVLSLSLLTRDWKHDAAHKVSFHRGIGDDDIVLFNGVDSGGIALEWYRREGLAGMDYSELEARLRDRSNVSAPLFLPYLTGVNPPDFFPHARGAILDLDLGHDRIDLAYAVEEGIAHLLRRNVDYLTAGPPQEIVSTGGGASSAFWSQLKADICGVDVVVPDEREATCRGAAVLALVAAGRLDGIDEFALPTTPETVRYIAHPTPERAARYQQFDDYLHRLYHPHVAR